ncbi:heme-binding protein 2 [Chanos chanos]|uniref:Heme-binding protein 1 n=1 Tax=Chanos chanos TaxID=29144 RepID=A0A6J2WRT7_CHACN|nr:heme-binding protein 2-like [Chanos chanos]
MLCLAGVFVLLLSVTTEARVGNSSESSFCTETEECLLYDLVCEGNGYEVRHYEPFKVVTTEVESYFTVIAAVRGFRTLAGYVTGHNAAGTGISMTTPVIMKRKENRSKQLTSVYEISFVLPSHYQTNPPAPIDESVKIVDMPDMHVYVRSYGGWFFDIMSRIQTYLLRRQLNSAQASYNTEYHFDVGYNSPMTIKDRHNEVWYVVEGEPVCPASE